MSKWTKKPLCSICERPNEDSMYLVPITREFVGLCCLEAYADANWQVVLDEQIEDKD